MSYWTSLNLNMIILMVSPYQNSKLKIQMLVGNSLNVCPDSDSQKKLPLVVWLPKLHHFRILEHIVYQRPPSGMPNPRDFHKMEFLSVPTIGVHLDDDSISSSAETTTIFTKSSSSSTTNLNSIDVRSW